MKNYYNKQNKGITLIALVITVIVLLILAGVAVSMALNEGNIFAKANEAKTSWNAKVAEENRINDTLAYIEQYVDGEGEGAGTPTVMVTPTPTVTPVQKQWEFATGGDKNNNGIAEVGDLIKPKIAAVASEQFYVINDDGTKLTLLAEKNVKTTEGIGQYTTQVGSTSADTVAFDSESPYTNVYADLSEYDIKGKVELYANHLADYLTLEDVETEEEGNPVTGIKGRLMWGTGARGEVKSLADACLMDVLFGPSENPLNYWLGTPSTGWESGAWFIFGQSGGPGEMDVDLDALLGVRPIIVILASQV